MAVALTIVVLVTGLVGTLAGTNFKYINGNADQESIFRARLLENYDRQVIPIRETAPVNCTLNFYPMRLLKSNFEDGYVELILWVDVVWNDYRLKWDANSSFFHIDHFAILRDEIWQPDLILLNGLTEPATQGRSVEQSVVFSTGDVSTVLALKMLVYCNDQGIKNSHEGKIHWMLCDMRFSSWMHNGWEINIIPGKTIHDTYFPLTMGKASARFSKSRHEEQFFDCCPGPYPVAVLPLYVSHSHE